MKKHWKLWLSTLMLVLVLAFTACGRNGGTGDGTGEDERTPEGDETRPVENGGGSVEEEARLLGVVDENGVPVSPLEINVVNWWTEECTDTIEPNTFMERERWDFRREMEERHNFKMRYIRYGSWHDVRDDVSTQILAMNRDYQMWIVEPTWFVAHNVQGLFAPISEDYFNDPYGIDWQHSMIELTLRSGVPHGWASGAQVAGGVYYNMRLLEEVGLPRDLPYTLQAENNWTWPTFLDMARQLSVDRDGDGIPDTWAITSFHSEVLSHALASNNAAYAIVNPQTGLIENSTNTDNFREAVEFVVQLREEMLAMHEDDVGGEWDAFVEMFNSGLGAIRVAADYVADQITLTDPWGFVAFPRGPRSDRHMAWVSSNFYTIPHFYSAEEVDDFMFAVQMWIRPLPDSDPDDWRIDNYTRHPDPRSVDETMALYTRNPDFQVMPAHNLMPIPDRFLGENWAWRMWTGNDPSVIIEEAMPVWDEFIERFNNMGN